MTFKPRPSFSTATTTTTTRAPTGGLSTREQPKPTAMRTPVSEKPRIFVTTSRGCEEALAHEIVELCADYGVALPMPPRMQAAGVSLDGDFEHIALLNLGLTVASRVLLVVGEGEARSEDDVYKVAFSIDWPRWFDTRKTFAIRADCRDSFARNSMFIALKVKDAIADKFRSQGGERPSVDAQNPQIPITVRLVGRELSIAIDTSGEALSHHGYRVESGGAPMRENLAAALIRYAGWGQLARALRSDSPQPAFYERPGTGNTGDVPRRIPTKIPLAPTFMDPMCGTGTLGIEAALLLLGRKPNSRRRHFAFLDLKDMEAGRFDGRFREFRQAMRDAEIPFNTLRTRIKAYAEAAQMELSDENLRFPIQCSDLSREALTATRRNAQEAGVADLIGFSARSFFDLQPSAKSGFLVCNPPYGERMGEGDEIFDFYTQMGNHLKHGFPGWMAWIVSCNTDALKKIGLRPTRKLSLYNGELPCSFAQFVLYGKSDAEKKPAGDSAEAPQEE